ncbi:MAG: hypothetical protein N2234_00950 [Planctomycetota bacterium]|nr:hypothetical protein [Planctomycetota bacterium]
MKGAEKGNGLFADIGQVRKNITRRHPEYERMYPQWQYFLDSYEGGQSYVSKPQYLFSHSRETAEDRAFRLRRVVYYNYCKAIVDLYVSYIYKKEILRESSNPYYLEFLQDVDLRSNDVDTMMSRYIAPLSQVFGVVFVIVDMPQITADRNSLNGGNGSGIRPYIAPILPFDVLDWELDSIGRFRWVKVREKFPSERSPFDEHKTQDYNYRIWTKDKWYLLDKEGDFLNPNGPAGENHPVGRVPIVAVYNERSFQSPIFGISALQDIAPCCQKIYNLSSLLDEFLYKQCFSFLAWPGDVDVEQLGTSNVATYDPETKALPHYITPPTDPAKFIESQIEKNIEEIYRLSRIKYVAVSSQTESGIARSIEFHDTNNILTRKARNLEQAEREIAELFFKWLGEKNDVTIQYPREFSIRAANEEVEEAIKVMSLNLSETLNARIGKRLVRTVLPSLNLNEEQRIYAEIDGNTAFQQKGDKSPR